jgi:hypothetical protein
MNNFELYKRTKTNDQYGFEVGKLYMSAYKRVRLTSAFKQPCPHGYMSITYLHKSAGWSVGFISNPTSLYS